jgi:alkyl hydroperoxide reductase subunit D
MSITALKERIPDFGRDIRLNLESVLSEDGAPGLTLPQLWSTALACAYAIESPDLAEAILKDPQAALLGDEYREGARAAAAIMAMNNVYYRTTHLMEDEALQKLPARLRMNIIGKPPVPKVDFEAMSFAVSALAGCGQCLTAHKNELRKAGMEDAGIHSLIRIASVIKAADSALRISRM